MGLADRFIKMRNRNAVKEIKIINVEHMEYDDITDEIERSLWDLKDSMDIPTDEIERSVMDRRRSRARSNNSDHS